MAKAKAPVFKPVEKEPSMLQVGASLVAIEAAHKAIMDILNAPHCDPTTKQTALQTLNTLCLVKDVNISNCYFTSGASS